MGIMDFPVLSPAGMPVFSINSLLQRIGSFHDGESENSEARDENGNPIEQTSLIGDNMTPHYGSTKKILVNQNNSIASSAQETSTSADGKKKRKKKPKDKEIKSEDMPGYKGDMGLEEVVKYIENDSTDNPSKAKKAKNGPSAAEKHTVQGAVLPQQQKTPPVVDVGQKKTTPNTNKESKKKKNGKNNVNVLKENALEENEGEIKLLNGIKIKDDKVPSMNTAEEKPPVIIIENGQKKKTEHEVKQLKILAAEKVEEDYPCPPLIQQPPNEEEEFKVVKKRDKKKPQSVVSGRNGGAFTSWSQQKAHSVDYDGRSKGRGSVSHQHHRSSTPPPPSTSLLISGSSSSSLSSQTDRPSSAGTARALSPSAFPSLTRQRRNSTGNAQHLTQVDNSSDDEDSHSAKSESKADSSCSSVISYANIAAGKGKKLLNDDSNATMDSTASCDRERRYSDSGVISADNFPVMNTQTVSADSRTCSSSGNIHEVVSRATTTHKSSSEPPHNKPQNDTKKSMCKNPSSSVVFLDEKNYSKNNSTKLDISFYFDADLATPSNEEFSQLKLTCNLPSTSQKVPNGVVLPPNYLLNDQGLSFGGVCSEVLTTSQSAISETQTITDNNKPAPASSVVAEAVPVVAAATSSVTTEEKSSEAQIVDDDIAFPPLQKNIVAEDSKGIKRTPPSRANDPNYQAGKFELEKAVTFLFSEWEYVSRLATNHPERVLYYGSASLRHSSK